MDTTKKIILTKSALIILAVLFSIFLVFNSNQILIINPNQLSFEFFQKLLTFLFSISVGLVGFCSLITVNNHFSIKKNKIINLIILFLTVILIIAGNSTFNSTKFTLISQSPSIINNFISFGGIVGAIFISLFIFIGIMYICIISKIHIYTHQ